jgi:hypothetical protein
MAKRRCKPLRHGLGPTGGPLAQKDCLGKRGF